MATASDGQARRAALVTGGTSGIGLAVVELLAEQGYSVFLCGRDGGAVTAVTDKLRGRGLDVDGIAADVTSKEDVRRLVRAARDRFGPLYLLVNNAGRGGGGKTAEIPDELWEDVIETNLNSVFRITPGGPDRRRDAGAGPRPHHQHRLHGRQAGCRPRRSLFRLQARRGRFHQGARPPN